MTFGSKRTLVNIIAGLALVVAYIFYAASDKSPEPDNLKLWAAGMLVFIGIGIVAIIVIQILFHIIAAVGIAAKEREYSGEKIEKIISSSMIEDERDKLISLKSNYAGYICAGFGFAAALACLAFGLEILYALHIIFGAFAAASILEGILSIVYYEKGIRNG